MGAYSSDVEEVIRGALRHVWDEHTPVDGTSLDEMRRSETAVFLASRTLPDGIVDLVEQFTDGRVAKACDWDDEEEHRVGFLPCGAPPGDLSVQHLRLTEMTTRERWAELHEHNDDTETPVCLGCTIMAEKEIAFTEH